MALKDDKESLEKLFTIKKDLDNLMSNLKRKQPSQYASEHSLIDYADQNLFA